MTDNEALEFCGSRLMRLEELKKLRKKIERRKPSEANGAAWQSVKDEVMSICDEVNEKLVTTDYRSDDISVTLQICKLLSETSHARRSYLPRY